jgi:outer membrane receptor for monomeric catechols
MEGDSQTDLYYNYQSYGEYSDLGALTQEASALYGELTYAVNDKVSVFGGLRKADESQSAFSGGVLRAEGDPPGGPWTGFAYTNSDSDYEYDNMSYRFGVEVKPSENGLVYLTRATSGRAPILQTAEGRLAFDAQGLPLSDTDASDVKTTELGTKWTLMDGDMDLELVYALAEWEEIPLYVGGGVVIGGTDADVESYEASFSWQVTDNFSLIYAGAYTATEVTGTPSVDGVDGVNYPSAITVGGKLYNYSPMTHSLTANYVTMLESGWEGYAGGTFARREAPNGFSSVLTPSGYIKAPSDYEALNLSAGVRKDQWDINFSIANATDFVDQYTPDYSGVNQSILMFPRSFHVRVSYSTF